MEGVAGEVQEKAYSANEPNQEGMKMSEYTKHLFENLEELRSLNDKGEERRYLTKQLADVLTLVADKIADIVEQGTEVVVGDIRYKVEQYDTRNGPIKYLTIEGDVIHGEPNQKWTLTPDNYTSDPYKVTSASRLGYLFFAKHMVEVIRAFEAQEDLIIATLKETLDDLSNRLFFIMDQLKKEQ